MNGISEFIQSHKSLIDALHAASSIINMCGWLVTLLVVLFAWRRGSVMHVQAFGMQFALKQQAVVAASRATREWAARDQIARKPGERSKPVPVDVGALRATIDRAFVPEVAERLAGKAILWVDDNPKNNTYETEALTNMGLVIEQALSTDEALDALKTKTFDLVISDMGRGSETRAGYDLLAKLRASRDQIPYILYAANGSNPAYVADALSRGAQGSTDHTRDLLDLVIRLLGETA